MPPEEVAFRVRAPGPLTDFTAERPHVSLSLWCDWTHEVVEMAGGRAQEAEALRAVLAANTRTAEGFALDDAVHVFVMDCIDLPHDSVHKAVDEATCLNLPPTRFERGWESYRVLSFEEEHTRRLLDALKGTGRELEVLGRRKLRTQPLLNGHGAGLPALLESLTEKQMDALILAHHSGYYASPKAVTAADIATKAGLSRSTFEEHLRKAEAKLLTGLVPWVELHRRARLKQD